MNLKEQARNVAKAGRYGDTELVHVSKDELRGIKALVPLTTNPETGLPEAFKLAGILPFLGAALPVLATGGLLGPGMAAMAASSPVMMGAAGGAVGGLASGAIEGDLEKGIKQGLMGGVLGGLGGMVTPMLSGAVKGVSPLASAAPATAPMPPVKPILDAAATVPPPPPVVPPVTAPVPPIKPAIDAAASAGPVAGRLAPAAGKGMLGGLGKYAAIGIPALLAMTPASGGKAPGRESPDLRRYRYSRRAFSPQPDPMGFERRYFSPGTFTPYADGGLVRYADGGEVEGVEDQDADDRQDPLVQEAIAVIMGNHPDPLPVIKAFIAKYGADAFEELVRQLRSDGRSDSIPAKQPGGIAALSEGEYVVPSDVVSGIGNGSTDAGARNLDAMVDTVRAAKQGAPMPPPEVEPRRVLPV